MESALVDQLLQGGAMATFAAFLVWQHVQNTKRNDLLVEKFQDQLTKINEAYDGRIEGIRERYDAVIEQYRIEGKEAERAFVKVREEVQSEVVSRLDTLTREIEALRGGSG